MNYQHHSHHQEWHVGENTHVHGVNGPNILYPEFNHHIPDGRLEEPQPGLAMPVQSSELHHPQPYGSFAYDVPHDINNAGYADLNPEQTRHLYSAGHSHEQVNATATCHYYDAIPPHENWPQHMTPQPGPSNAARIHDPPFLWDTEFVTNPTGWLQCHPGAQIIAQPDTGIVEAVVFPHEYQLEFSAINVGLGAEGEMEDNMTHVHIGEMDELQPTQGPSTQPMYPARDENLTTAPFSQGPTFDSGSTTDPITFEHQQPGTVATSSSSRILVSVGNLPSEQTVEKESEWDLAAISYIALRNFLNKAALRSPDDNMCPFQARRKLYYLYMEKHFDDTMGIAIMNPGEINIGDIGRFEPGGFFKKFYNLADHTDQPLPPNFLEAVHSESDRAISSYNCKLRSHKTPTKLSLSIAANSPRVMLAHDKIKYEITVDNRKELGAYARSNGAQLYATVKKLRHVDVEDGDLLMVITTAGWRQVTQFLSVPTRKDLSSKPFKDVDIDIPASDSTDGSSNFKMVYNSDGEGYMIRRFGWDKFDDVQITHMNVIPLSKTPKRSG